MLNSKKFFRLKKKIKLPIQVLELKIDWFELNSNLMFNWDLICRKLNFFDMNIISAHSFKNFNFSLLTTDVKSNSDLNLVKSIFFLKQLLNLNFSNKICNLLRSPFSSAKKKFLKSQQANISKNSTSDNAFYLYPNLNFNDKIKFIKFYFIILMPYFLKRQIQFKFNFSKNNEIFQFILTDVPQLLTNNFFYLFYDYFEWNHTIFFFNLKNFWLKKDSNLLLARHDSHLLDFKCLSYNCFLRLN
jgi:hypothetical protein